MAKSAYNGANVTIATDTFGEWIERTNQLVYDSATIVLTAADVAQPNTTNYGQVSGNSYINGTFTAGETIRGETSGATYTIVNQNKFDMTESYNENYQIQIEADDIIDFTRRNPFGDP